MPNFEKNLRQTLTYWEPGDTDIFGKQDFAAPVSLKCRWEDRIETITDKNGQQRTSKSRIFLAQLPDLNGYLLLGDSSETDPLTLSGAYEIMSISTVPDLRNLKTMYVAYL